jgi:hypothetical protein
MRLLELKNLFEGPNLAPSELIKPNSRTNVPRIDIFARKVTAGEPFPTTDGRSVIIDKTEIKRIRDLMAQGQFGGKTISVNTDQGPISLSNLKKTGEFGALAGDVADKIGNRGDISEGILGAALFAKMRARVNGKIKTIASGDIWGVIDSLQLQKTVRGKDKEDTWGEYTVKVKDVNQATVKDSIVFTLKLKEGPFKEIMDTTKRPLLNKEISGAVEYANSADAEEFASFFYLNGKPDIIHVITDGLSDQTGKKSDIEVIVTDPKTGKQHEQRLNISLKAGSAQIAQVGGGTTIADDTKGKTAFEAQDELWSKLGIDVVPFKEEFESMTAKSNYDSFMGAFQFMYHEVTDLLRRLLSGNYDDEEYLYISDFIKAINYFATLGNPNIVLINLEKGSYSISSFANLESQLQDIDLNARYVEQDESGLPIVEVFDINSSQLFLRIRSYRKSKVSKSGEEGWYFRNYIETGPLLKQLTSIKKK